MKNKDTVSNYVKFMRELKQHEGKSISASEIAKKHNVYPSTVLIMDKIGYAKTESKVGKGTFIHKVNYTDPSIKMAELLAGSVNKYIVGKLTPIKPHSGSGQETNLTPAVDRKHHKAVQKHSNSKSEKRIGVIRRFFKWLY